jgi:hypothetical protein
VLRQRAVIASGEVSPTTGFGDEVRVGDVLLSDAVAGVLHSDQGLEGVLDGEDLVLTARDFPPVERPLALVFDGAFDIYRWH